MAKIKDTEGKFTLDPSEAITKIQLLTKTSSENDTSLADIQLDLGEPLVNTNDKTLIIGTGANKAANDASTIVLGNGRNVITDNGNNTITLKHFDGSSSTARSSQSISVTGGSLSADGDGNVEIDLTQIQTKQIQVDPIYESLGINPTPDPDKNGTDLFIDSQGWYRIFTSTIETGDTGGLSPFCLFTLGRSHNSPVNETYTFLITVNNNDVNIAQLSGQRHSSYIIDQIRVPMEIEGNYHKQWYVDIHLKEYYTLRDDSSKQYYAQTIAVWGIGTGKFQEPTKVADYPGDDYDVKEFSTDIGLYNSEKISAPEITASGNISISGMNSSSIKLKARTAPDNGTTDPDWITIENIGDDKAFIRFTYNVNNTNGNPDESCWRIGYDGVGDSDANKFVINTTHSHDKTISWREAFSISQNTLTATFNGPLTTAGAITAGNSESYQRVTAGSFNAMSDARLKENFQPLTPEKSILDLPTYKFDFINGAKNQIGCKAQDLQEICPEIVNAGDDGYLSIQESKIVYLLLEEVKKLRKEIDELTRKSYLNLDE